MKKLLLALIFLMNITYADYTFMIPLEQSGGGALPNNSITFGQTDTSTPPANQTGQFSVLFNFEDLLSSSSNSLFDEITIPNWGAYGIDLKVYSKNTIKLSIASVILTDTNSNMINLPLSNVSCQATICSITVNNAGGSNIEGLIFNGGSLEIKVNYEQPPIPK
jgi:hypothetical protein